MTVLACPECNKANPYHRKPSVQGFDHAHQYRCEHCDARFNEPVEREADGSQECLPGHSLAATLDALDADEVGP